jgi:8-oxo-dGTP diphosphatase
MISQKYQPSRVVAGVLVNRLGEVLIAQRPVGKWQEGRWEFPGGKLETGEDEETAVRRELAEELGIRVEVTQRLAGCQHDYGDRCVDMGLWLVLRYFGEPQGLDGQALKWVTLQQLSREDLLEADVPLVAVLEAALGAGRAI